MPFSGKSLTRKDACDHLQLSHDRPMPLFGDGLENHDWARLIAIVAAVFLLFFYTRSCPFPAGMFWDLLSGRDFPASNQWIFSCERIAFSIAQSSAGLIGLKTVFHVLFFLICGTLTIWAFKGPESIPGIIVLGLFAFAIQPLLGMRDLLLLVFMGILFSSLDNNRFRHSYGLILIPFTAAASGLGLPAWLIPALVTCHVLWGENLSPSLILCSLLGLLVFIDPSLGNIFGTSSLSMKFPHPDDLQMLHTLAAIFLIPNLVALPLLGETQLPNLAFYCLLGIVTLITPIYAPLFIMTGALLLLSGLSQLSPLSLNLSLIGVLILVAVFHLFLFLNPFGFRINPSVRAELGGAVVPLLSGASSTLQIARHEVGELAWKGLIVLNEEHIQLLLQRKHLFVIQQHGQFDLTGTAPEKATVASSTDISGEHRSSERGTPSVASFSIESVPVVDKTED
jgi:hypothetical protein